MPKKNLTGVNLYSKRSLVVCGVLMSITGAGMICRFIYNQMLAIGGPGPATQVGAVMAAIIGFAIISYLTDYGWFKTGVGNVSMLLRGATWRNWTYAMLALSLLTINLLRLGATLYFTYGSKGMNADLMVRDAQTTDVASSIGNLQYETNKSVEKYQQRIDALEKRKTALQDPEQSLAIAGKFFTSDAATATQNYHWQKMQQGNQHSQNKVSAWIRDQLAEVNRDLRFNQEQLALAASPLQSIGSLTEEIQKDNDRKRQKTTYLEAHAENFFGIIGLGACIWSILITIAMALAGDFDEEDAYTVRSVGLAIEDFREMEDQTGHQKRITERMAEEMERLIREQKEAKERQEQLEAKLSEIKKPHPASSSGSAKTKGKGSNGKWSLYVAEGSWFLSGKEVDLSDVKMQAYKWKQRAYKYQQEGKTGLYSTNQAKWNRAKELFDENGIAYTETADNVSYG